MINVRISARTNFLRNHLTSVGWVIWFDIILLLFDAHLRAQNITAMSNNRKERKNNRNGQCRRCCHRCHHQNFSEIKLSKGQKMLSIILSIHRFFSFFFVLVSFTAPQRIGRTWTIAAYIYVRPMTKFINFIWRYHTAPHRTVLAKTPELLINAEIMRIILFPLADQRTKTRRKYSL